MKKKKTWKKAKEIQEENMTKKLEENKICILETKSSGDQ